MNRLKINLLMLIVVTLSTLFITACKEKEPHLTASPASLTFEADDTKTAEITIATDAKNWDFSDDSEGWIDASKNSSNLLSVRVREHMDTSGPRSAIIKITAGKSTFVEINVQQKAKKINTLSASPGSLSYNANETGEKTVAITTDAPSWVASNSNSNSWIRLSQQSNTLTVNVTAQNTQPETRSGEITITAGNAPSIKVTVTQGAAPHTLSVSTSSINFTADETSARNVTVTTNASSWSASVPSSVNWLTLGSSPGTLTVTPTRNTSNNERTATITVSAGTAPSASIRVTQAGIPQTTLTLNPTALTFNYNETTNQPVTVTTNASSWSYSTTASWITLGRSNNILNVRPNATWNGSSARTADVIVTAGTQTATLRVTQNGYTAPAMPITSTYNYSATGTYLINFGDAAWQRTSWSGRVVPNVSNTPPYIRITNFGDLNLEVYCDYFSGQYRIDNTTRVANYAEYDGYLCMATLSGSGDITLYPNNTFNVSYNTSTRILNFSGTYNGQTVCVGVAAKNRNTGQWSTTTFFSNFYSNLRIQLTTTSSSPFTGNGMDTNSKLNGFNGLTDTKRELKLIEGPTVTIIE